MALMPTPQTPPGGAAPGARPPAAPGPLKSPVGGPSGPGGSPMVSPGTGAGVQARALAGTKKVIETLMQYARSFEPGTPQFNAYMGAIRTLNGVFKGTTEPEAAATPLPVPATTPGAGVGGLGTPPTGVTAPGGPTGGAGPLTPGG